MGRPPTPPPKPLGVLSVIAITIGAAAIGCWALDLHSHRCDSCNRKWRHFGAFSFGDPKAHTCATCGTTQFWKDGFQQVFRDPGEPPQVARALAPWQPSESRAAPDRELGSKPRETWPNSAPYSKEYNR